MPARKLVGHAAVCGVVLVGGSALGGVQAGAVGTSGGDFDAKSYDVKLDYRPGGKQLTGVTDIKATAAQDLDSLQLRLGFPTQSVEVDGVRAAGFEAKPADREKSGSASLTVRPAHKIKRGKEFTIRVRYAGDPAKAGWMGTTDGGVISTAGTRWFAAHANDTDRARLNVTATVPAGWSAMSSGLKGATERKEGRETYHWSTAQDLTDSESIMNIGPWQIEESRLKDGKPAYYAYGKGLKEKAAPYVSKQQELVDFLGRKFGKPYPYSSLGGIFVEPTDEDSPFLESQGRVNFAGALRYWDEPSYVHEWTHQWFGTSVAPGKAPGDAMTTEGVCQYAAWMWDESHGKNLDERYRSEMGKLRKDPKWWANNGVQNGMGVYNKGAYLLHALRHQIGDSAFNATLKKWQAENSGKTRGWADMKRMFSQVSGQDLTEFFAQWDSNKVPAEKYLMPGTLAKP
ncbi:hypothetical protein ACFVZM_25340 [Streptomyces sioyaensis]|uniref:hypothetical protein n=1 Tax=Streptomyces sioyaensis TaxID=67364 RepID=UPI003685EDB8